MAGLFDGKLAKATSGRVGQAVKSVSALPVTPIAGAILATKTNNVLGNAAVLVLSTAWIGLGAAHLIKRSIAESRAKPSALDVRPQDVQAPTPKGLDRQDYTQVSFMRLGETVMPPTQTYELRGAVEVNESQLVDGVDIIQLVRRKAKTIDCEIRFKFDAPDSDDTFSIRDAQDQVRDFARMITELAESQAVFEVSNDRINNVFGVEYALMLDYRYRENAGSTVSTFTFTLKEVKYGENVLTFDARQTNDTVNRTL